MYYLRLLINCILSAFSANYSEGSHNDDTDVFQEDEGHDYHHAPWPKHGSTHVGEIIQAAEIAGFDIVSGYTFFNAFTQTLEFLNILFHYNKGILLTLETTDSMLNVSRGHLYANWKRANTHDFSMPASLSFRGSHSLSMLADRIPHLERTGSFVIPWKHDPGVSLLHDADYHENETAPAISQPTPARPRYRPATSIQRFDALELIKSDNQREESPADTAPSLSFEETLARTNTERISELPPQVLALINVNTEQSTLG